MDNFGVPGPVITFTISSLNLSPVENAMKEAQGLVRQTTQSMAAEWQKMSAQLRASLAVEDSALSGIKDQRLAIVGVIDKELGLLRQKESLTTKELASLKAMTLERERQTDAIKRGASIGLTAGTNQVVGQLQNTMRQLAGTLGAGLFGIMGGSQLANVSSAFGAGGAVAGGVTALLAAGAGIVKMGVDGGKLAVELDNLARRTGMTTENVVKLRSASEALDIDFDSAVTGFRKLDQELTIALSANLPNAFAQAKKAGELFNILGVNVKEAAANPYAAITQLATAFRQLPDDAVKSSVAVAIFGRGGLALVPVLDKLSPALDATSKSSRDLIQALGGDAAAKSADALKASMVNLNNEWEALEIEVSKNVIPSLISLVHWINNVADAAHVAATPVDRASAQIVSQLRADRQQLTPLGERQLDFFLTNQNQQGGVNRYLADPQQGINDFRAFVTGEGGDLTGNLKGNASPFEAFDDSLNKLKEGVDQSGQSAGAAAKMHGDLAGVLGTTAEAAGKAGKGILALWNDWQAMLARIQKSTEEGTFKMYTSHPGRTESPFEIQQKHDDVYSQLLHPEGPIDLGFPTTTGAAGLPSLAPFNGITPAVPKPPVDIPALLRQINDEHEKLYTTQDEKDRQHYQDEKETLDKFYGDELKAFKGTADQKLAIQQEWSAASLKISQDWAKTQEALDKKYEEQAGKLFDDLISGKGKSFSKQLEKDLEDIALKPFKDQFSKSIGTMFSNISNIWDKTATGGTGSSAGGASTSTAAGGWLGKVEKWFGIGSASSPTAPGGTAGTYPGPIGNGAGGGVGAPSGSTSSTAPPVSGGQSGIVTQTMTVNAEVVNIGGPGATGGAGPLGGGTGVGSLVGSLTGATGTSGATPLFASGGAFANLGVGFGLPALPNLGPGFSPITPGSGSFFGPSSALAGFDGSFFGNNNPFGGSTSATAGTSGSGGFFSSSGVGGAIGSALPGLLLGGLSATSGNVAGEAMGAGSAASALSQALANSGTISSNTGQGLSGIFGGAGMLAAGISQGGGVKGTLEDTMGGAELGGGIGMLAAGPAGAVVGLAIGAIAGALTGGIQSIFGSDDWQNRVKADMKKQFVALPPSESFSFASNGSIASTLGTGMAQSGDTFSQYALPSNTPFTAKPVFGPLTNAQKSELQQLELGMNPNEPFGGFPTTNPFTGQDPAGYKPYPNTPPGTVNVNLNLPGLVDPQMADAVFTQHASKIAQLIGRQSTNSSSGFGTRVRSVATLP